MRVLLNDHCHLGRLVLMVQPKSQRHRERRRLCIAFCVAVVRAQMNPDQQHHPAEPAVAEQQALPGPGLDSSIRRVFNGCVKAQPMWWRRSLHAYCALSTKGSVSVGFKIRTADRTLINQIEG